MCMLKKLAQKEETLPWNKETFIMKVYEDGHFWREHYYYSQNSNSLFTPSFSLILLLSFFLSLLVLLAWFTNEDHTSYLFMKSSSKKISLEF